ncbi:MAG: VWA domain-containing protein [Flavobacteriales bacterium]|nr:VWA domain-containing protein [Flavobacteriales bacterium]
MFELDEPKYLLTLALIPIFGALFFLHIWWKKKEQQKFATAFLFEKLVPNYSNGKIWIKFTLWILAIVFLAIALVNPKIGTKMETIKREGIDIVFAIDVSKSMLAEDIAPNRLEKSKQLVSQIMSQLQTDRIGMVAYAGSAFPVLPLTSDYNAARMFLQSMNPTMISTQGTSIDEAIEQSSNYFDQGNATNKLVVLISDGEDHSDNVETALETALTKKIKILTIGVGTDNGGPIPVKEKGQNIGFIRDKNDEVVITKLNQSILENIGNKTKGGYILGNNTKEVVEYVTKKIATIEKTERESTQMTDFQSQYQWFLAIAFFLILIDVFLLERKTSLLAKWNLFNDKPVKR